MSVEQDFIPFGNTATSLESLASYATDAPGGNVPGVASSAYNNRALRQANAIASALAQYLANVNNTDVLDNANQTQLLSKLFGAIGFLQPVRFLTTTSGSGTFNLTYKFKVLSANATTGATYTDSASTVFTVTTTISGGLELQASGSVAPATGTGTLALTKTSGTGDATITYEAVRAPKTLYLQLLGAGGGGGGCAITSSSQSAAGGGGGAGSYGELLINNPLSTYAYVVGAGGAGGNTGANNGSDGGATTFGTSLYSASGGAHGNGSTAGTTAGIYANGGAGDSVGINLGMDFYIIGDSGTAGAVLIAGSSGYMQIGNGGISAINLARRQNSTIAFGATNSGVSISSGLGAGGAGGYGCSDGTGRHGDAGGNGMIIVTQYY